MKGLLKKLSSNENELRTSEVKGSFSKPPIVGESFRILSIPLDRLMDIREVATSKIVKVETFDDYYLFSTLNSEYRLDIYK